MLYIYSNKSDCNPEIVQKLILILQADVGKALAHLKMPGVGSLSQSTICRFESLTLSHNNMVALKPILHSWLEKAEEAMKQKDTIGDINGILPNTDKKRKRTSIAAPEKRELEQFFKWVWVGESINSKSYMLKLC